MDCVCVLRLRFDFFFLEACFCGFMSHQWVSCTVHRTCKLFFNNFFIKNESHGTIHTFKNYFATVFSVFNKISGIQTDPKLVQSIIRWIRYRVLSLILIQRSEYGIRMRCNSPSSFSQIFFTFYFLNFYFLLLLTFILTSFN